jgi:catechol 2,3-dioxygenase-like lactoylglutathione lyase family enzyme
MSRFFGKAAHTAIVVPDMAKAIEAMTAAGIGPFFAMPSNRAPARYRGARHDPLLSVAFVSTDRIQYELLTPLDDVPSAYSEYLERHPQGGVHHVGYWAEDFDEALERAARGGCRFRIVQEFIDERGEAFEVYCEPVGQDDPLLIQLMKHSPFDAFFEQVEQAARDWDGSDPVRDAFQLLPPELKTLSA